MKESTTQPEQSWRPFNGQLEPLEGTDYANDAIETLDTHPEVIIRQDKIHGSQPLSSADIQEVVDRARHLRAAHEELASFGVRVLPNRPVVGHGDQDGEVASYVVTDKVTGNPVNMIMGELNEKAVHELDDTIGAICKYYVSILKNPRRMLCDVHADQLMYGKTQDDPEAHIYFADLSDSVSEFDSEQLDLEMGWLREDILEIESASGNKLAGARQEYQKLVSEYLRQDYVVRAGVTAEELELGL